MDEQTYQQWWPLHLRMAKGETLSAEEQIVYEAGCRALDAEETLPGSVEELRQARQRTQELKAEYVRLRTEYEALEAEIARLEARLSEPTKRLLGVGG